MIDTTSRFWGCKAAFIDTETTGLDPSTHFGKFRPRFAGVFARL